MSNSTELTDIKLTKLSYADEHETLAMITINVSV